MVGWRGGFWLALTLMAGGCAMGHAPAPSTGSVRERLADLARRQVAFGSVSLLPVRFERSRIAGPFEDGGRRLYCISTRMKGRSLDEPERPKLVVREQEGNLSVLRAEEDVCEGHRTEPFTELDSPASYP